MTIEMVFSESLARLNSMPFRTRYTEKDLAQVRIGTRSHAALSFRINKMRPGFPSAGEHSLVPADLHLLEKLGMERGQKTHYFAVFTGGWARAMANSGLDIEATDVSAELIFKLDYNLGRIAHTRVQAAEYGAVVPNFYDWSFSFEPYPVFDRCFGVEEVSRLGLLNNLGLKVAYKSEGCVLDENHGLRLACLAEVYEASMDTKVVEIDGFAGGKAGTYKSSIISLATNPKARKKAELDIYVERAMHSITAKGGCLVKILSEKLEVEGPLIRESVERLRLCEESGVVTLG